MQRYAITDGLLVATDDVARGREEMLRAQVARWVGDGVEWVQLREKDLPGGELLRLAGDLAPITSVGKSRLVVNGLPPELARQCGAAGVHLPGGATAAEVSAAQAVGLVSVSCHSLTEIVAAADGGASAILWAPVFEKVVQGRVVRRGTGLDALKKVCALAGTTPVFALGGVTWANAALCMRAGAAGVAGIRLFQEPVVSGSELGQGNSPVGVEETGLGERGFSLNKGHIE